MTIYDLQFTDYTFETINKLSNKEMLFLYNQKELVLPTSFNENKKQEMASCNISKIGGLLRERGINPNYN